MVFNHRQARPSSYKVVYANIIVDKPDDDACNLIDSDAEGSKKELNLKAILIVYRY